MDKHVRELERRFATSGSTEDGLVYANALRRVVLGGSRLSFIQEQFLKNQMPLLLPEAQPVSNKEGFPPGYVGFAVIELNETIYWDISVVAQVGYIGGVYLVDLTNAVHLASFTRSYGAMPLHYSVRIEIDDEMENILSDGFQQASNDFDYFDMPHIRQAVDWVLIDADDYYDPDEEEDVMEQIRQGLQGNWVL